MFSIFVASCLLAFSAARVADVKKEIPAWPNVFSATILITNPYEIGEGGHAKEGVGKLWYDGEEGKMKTEFLGKTRYILKDNNGGVIIEVDSTGKCEVKYGVVIQGALSNPLPAFDDKAEFISKYDVEGEEVEQWKVEGSPDKTILYIRKQDGVAIPVRFELFPDIPPVGGDMILPIVAEFVEFSTAKPDASVFDIDASKCENITNIPFFLSFF